MTDVNTDPKTWFSGAKRVVFVHAHPDDETIATGGTLAGLSAAGKTAGVITLTRGERGEATPGPFASLVGTPDLAPHREQELHAALFMLGVEDHIFLGTNLPGRSDRVYEDSGMVWGDHGVAVADPATGPVALTKAAAVDIINDLLFAVLTLECDAIVSYNAEGGYGHPDHVLAHQVARAVAAAIEVPFWEIVQGSTVDQADDVESYDVSEWLERKVGALRMHGTQLTVVNDTELEHVGGQREPIATVERYRKLETLSL